MRDENSEKILNELVINFPHLRLFVETLQFNNALWNAQTIAVATDIPARTIRHYFKIGKLKGSKGTLIDMWVANSEEVAEWAINYLPAIMEKRKDNG